MRNLKIRRLIPKGKDPKLRNQYPVIFDLTENGKRTSMTIDSEVWCFLIQQFDGQEAIAFEWLKKLRKKGLTKSGIRLEVMSKIIGSRMKTHRAMEFYNQEVMVL